MNEMNVYDDRVIEIADLADFHYEMAMREGSRYGNTDDIKYHEGAYRSICNVLAILTGYFWCYKPRYNRVLPYYENGEIVEEWQEVDKK